MIGYEFLSVKKLKYTFFDYLDLKNDFPNYITIYFLSERNNFKIFLIKKKKKKMLIINRKFYTQINGFIEISTFLDR